MRIMVAPLLVLVLLTAPCVRAAEVQRHGIVWESWVADTFFGGYRQASYTQKWDIPAEANAAHGGIPANPKFTKHHTPSILAMRCGSSTSTNLSCSSSAIGCRKRNRSES